MKTALITIACLIGAAAVPALGQDAPDDSSSETFEEAFGEPGDADSPSDSGYHEETVDDWRLYDGLTDAGERRVFMHRELAPESSLEFDLQEGGGASIALVDPDCAFVSQFSVEELGEDRAAGLAEKLANAVDEAACDAPPPIPTAEELAEPLALLGSWVAERPFPAAGYWKAETRPLTLGRGEGSGVGRYQGRVSIVYLEPDEDSRGPAEVAVNIYDCVAFSGRTLPVTSGNPAEAQDIARAVLEERAEACGLDPETPARLADGLPEGLAAQKDHRAAGETGDDDAFDDPTYADLQGN